MTREQIIKKAWLFIAENDEDAKIIPDGKIEEGKKFLADFAESILELS